MLYLFNPFIKNFMSLMPSTEVIVTQKSFNSKSFSQYYSIQPSPYKRMYNYIILYIATYISYILPFSGFSRLYCDMDPHIATLPFLFIKGTTVS